MSERFGKSRRVLKRTDFLRIQREGQGVRAPHHVVVVRLRHDDQPARLGIVASRRVGGSVQRNRGKRRIREWFRRHACAPQGTDVVVILRPGAPSLDVEESERELDEALRRALRKATRRAP